MVETKQARIRDNRILDVVKRALTCTGPDGSRLIMFLFNGKSSKGRVPKFKVIDVFAGELGKPNQFSNITNNLGHRPCLGS